jgi:DNA polymerase III psi subunit
MAVLSLYTETLYSNEQIPEAIAYKGLFQKKICIVAIKSDLTEENEATLLKIIANCKLSLDDCAIYTIDKKEVGAFYLALQLRPEKLILFGAYFNSSTTQLITEYYALKKVGNMQIILSETLAQLNANVQHKHLLWAQLKLMFGIN